MPDFDLTRIDLPTGVTLDVATAGSPDNPAIILLHGFPESHRTWRDVMPGLAETHYVVAPDQRGFARSTKLPHVADYTPDKMVADLIALADHLMIDRFTLVGHDWGGAIAWMAALTKPDRVARLIILNAPHPFVFQRTLFDDMDQRAASQYITAFRNPNLERHVESIGVEAFFDTTFERFGLGEKLADEKATYLDQWSQPGAITGMFNWYRASQIIVPGMDATPERPAFLDAPFPPVTQPTLVIWGMHDKALLPSQLDGLDALVPDLTIVHVDAGHFVPWKAPEAVVHTIRQWLG